MALPDIRFFPQNWENGMKLGAEHFRHLEDSIEDHQRDTRAMALALAGGYGLLPDSELRLAAGPGSTPQAVRLTLESCRAVLPGGFRVEIMPALYREQQIPLVLPAVEFIPAAGVRFHIYLVVREGRRLPAGTPLTRPIRHPHLFPECSLECLPQDKARAAMKPGPDRMKLGEWLDGKLVEGYIPPLLSLRGHPLGMKWFQYFQSQLDAVVRFGTQVIQEHRVKDPNRALFCAPLIQFIRSTQGRFRWQIPDGPPLELIAYFGDLAGLADSLLDTMDRDFVRNQLRDGQNHQLRPCIQMFLQLAYPPAEETAAVFVYMQRFAEALQLTVRGLITYQAPTPRSGERHISAG